MLKMRYWFEFIIVVAIRSVSVMLPRQISLLLGSGIGLIFYVLYRRRRELAIMNLRSAFPAWDKAQCHSTLRATFKQLGRHVIDLFNFSSMKPESMLNLVEVEGMEHVQEANSRSAGVMYFAGHFGSWELQIMVHAHLFDPIVMIARTLDNPYLENMIEQMRGRIGTRVVPRAGAVRGLLRALKDRISVGMMIDQHIQDRSAVVVDFLGRPAATTSTIAALALRTGAPIIPVFAIPTSDGRYRMIYEEPVEPPEPGDPNPVLTYTQRCTDVLESYIRRHPHLWLWMHRRWRQDEKDPTSTV